MYMYKTYMYIHPITYPLKKGITPHSTQKRKTLFKGFQLFIDLWIHNFEYIFTEIIETKVYAK